VGQIYERWDGKAWPNKLKGEALLLPVRVVQLAHDAELFSRLGGAEAAVTMARERAGGLFDPHLVEHFCQQTGQLLEESGPVSLWEAVLAAEPGPRPCLAEAQLHRALRAVADFVDLKSPYTVGHSSGVAELAAEAAQQRGLPEADVQTLRRAGWLHDLGRIGVSNMIWDKPGPLKEKPVYILFITSTKSLQELEPVFPVHNAYLDTNYKTGKLILNGELTAKPAVVLLANVTSEEELQALLAADPFVREHLVEFEVIEFKPSRYHQSLASLIAPAVKHG
jgi:uncharacterized protein YciI